MAYYPPDIIGVTPGKYRWKINIRQFNNKENFIAYKYKIMYLTHKDKLLNQSVILYIAAWNHNIIYFDWHVY